MEVGGVAACAGADGLCSSQVAEAKGKADEARLQAQAALDKANQTRARVEHSNKELRDLISHVKAFLSREYSVQGGYPHCLLCPKAQGVMLMASTCRGGGRSREH